MDLRTLDLVSTVVIPATPGQVWSVFADARRWPEWSRVIAAVTVAPERWEPGARLVFRLRIGGVVVPFDVTVTAAEPPRLVTWTSVRWTVTGTRTHTFEAMAQGSGAAGAPPTGALGVPDDAPAAAPRAAGWSGTRATDHKRFEHPAAPLRWVYPRAVIRRMSETWLEDLARACGARGGV